MSGFRALRMSGSKRKLFRLCQYWAQDGVEWSDSGPSAYASVGLALHDWSEAVQSKKKPSLDAIAEARGLSDVQKATLERLVASFRTGVHVPMFARAEVTFAYDPRLVDADTGRVGFARELGQGLGRKYKEAGLQKNEVPCTCDLIWWNNDTIVIPDIKSGYQGETEDAAWNDQLLFLALAASRAYNVSNVRILVWRITEDDVVSSSYDVDETELDVLATSFRDEVVEFDRGGIAPKPGSHCKALWCPAAATCPAATKAVESIIPAEKLLPSYRVAGAISSPEEATYRLKLLPLLKSFLDAYEKTLRDYSDENGGIPIDDGHWGKVVMSTEKIVANADSLAIIEEYLGPEGVQAATKFEVSRASIERAVRAKGLQPVAPAVNAIIEDIKKAGAVKCGTTESYRVRKGRAA